LRLRRSTEAKEEEEQQQEALRSGIPLSACNCCAGNRDVKGVYTEAGTGRKESRTGVLTLCFFIEVGVGCISYLSTRGVGARFFCGLSVLL
jgi:hypothetical protein